MKTNKIIQFITVLIIAIALGACNNVEPIAATAPDGGIAFYNASQVLTSPLILLNTDDVNYKPDSLAGVVEEVGMPEFKLSTGKQWMAPAGAISDSYPWVSYVRVLPGLQQVTFLTADKKAVTTINVPIAASESFTVYLTDSMGTCHSYAVSDQCSTLAGKVQLNMVHVSPDAGKLLLRVNNKWLNDKTMNYRGNTGFVSFDAPGDNTQLDVVVSNAADTTDLLGTTVIMTKPGHCYTLILKGYVKGYTNPVINPGFQLSVVKNK